MLDTYKNAAQSLGLLDMDEVALEKYKQLIIEWNEKFNITSITDSDEMDIKHFADSITPFLTELLNGSKRVIDIGTGGGFPGIVLKLYNKDLKITLMDSLNKRIGFLNTVIEQLGLSNIVALHARAEELARRDGYRDAYDVSISRAVAPLNTLAEYCLPFVKVDGYFIAMKGPEPEAEIAEAATAIKKLGASFFECKKVNLPGTDIVHSLVVYKKDSPTPKVYPRAGGKPKSKPL